MNKGLIILQIVIWGAIGLALLGLLLFFPGWGWAGSLRVSDANLRLAFETSQPLSGVESLSVDVTSLDVIIEESSTGELGIAHYSAGSLPESERVTVEQAGGSLSIRQPVLPGFRLFSLARRQKLVLSLPASYAHALSLTGASGDVRIQPALRLEALQIKLTSGNVTLEQDVAADTFGLRLTSGDIRLRSVASASYDIASTSGNLYGEQLTGSGAISMTSGDIRLDEISGLDHRIDTVSGNIRLSSISGAARLSASSGDITAAFFGPLGDIQAEALSGNVRLTLPQEANASIRAACGSGRISGDVGFSFDEKGKSATASVGSAPYANVELRTGSGNIEVNVG